MLGPGDTAWGARLQSPHDDYFLYTLGAPMGAKGGSGTVHQLLPRTNPPLVAKLYHGQALDRIRQERRYAQRVIALARHRDELAKALPFATWPRRLIFSDKHPRDPQASLLGFSMERLVGTTSLYDLIASESARFKLSPDNTAYICITLADQIARMHRHPWTFVFGDLSPNNVHVTARFDQVRFIDTDGFQFDYNNGKYAFALSGLTNTFKSPGADAMLASTGRVNTQHDDFVLAILIFMLLMAQKGFGLLHPFQSGGSNEDDNINARRFPFDDTSMAVPPVLRNAYASLPQTLRDTFTRAFTRPSPVPAAEWTIVLSQYRRSL